MFLHVTPENQGKFEALKDEFDELGENIKTLSDQLDRMKNPPAELSQQVMDMTRRQVALMSQMRALNTPPQNEEGGA